MPSSYTSIIFLGPSTDLSPICTDKYPKFSVPILNEPLLLHNLRWMEEVSDEILVVGLEKYGKGVNDIITEGEIKKVIKFVGIEQYDGTYNCLKKIISDVKTDNIIVSKGDIISFVSLSEVIEAYSAKNADALVILKKSTEKTSIVGYHEDNILFYNNDINGMLKNTFFLEHNRVTFTCSLDISQVYIMRTKIIKETEDEHFSLKNNFFPALVSNLQSKTPVKLFYAENMVFQIQRYDDLLKITKILKKQAKNLPTYPYIDNLKNLNDKERIEYIQDYYLKNKIFFFKTKNRISFSDDRNIVGIFLKIDKSYLKNNVIGNNCEIENQCIIEECIIFNNVKIGKNCRLKRCIICNDVKICDGCVLSDCKIIGGYVFESDTTAKGRVFMKSDC